MVPAQVKARGDTRDIVAELRHLFADSEILRGWWPGTVDAVSCLEGREVLDLLVADVLGDDPSGFRRLKLHVDVAATLRGDGDDVIFAAAARRGVMVDGAFYARDIIVDAMALAREIYHRRLHAAAAEAPAPAWMRK